MEGLQGRAMDSSNNIPNVRIRPASRADVPVILALIHELAEYERLSHEVTATEAQLKEHLFGSSPKAEVLIAELAGRAVGFALFFHNFSTFLAKPGIYLEDLYVRPEHRGKRIGTALLKHLAKIAIFRECGRLEWAVLDWNEPAIRFYKLLHAQPMNDWTIYRVTGSALENLAADE
jgi:GNAT superfamily N-acetyltransferase